MIWILALAQTGGDKDKSSNSDSDKTASKSKKEKHACKGQNSCKGKGGCGTTKGKNDCKGKGGCRAHQRTLLPVSAPFDFTLIARNRASATRPSIRVWRTTFWTKWERRRPVSTPLPFAILPNRTKKTHSTPGSWRPNGEGLAIAEQYRYLFGQAVRRRLRSATPILAELDRQLGRFAILKGVEVGAAIRFERDDLAVQ
jgi:hypothetical protein